MIDDLHYEDKGHIQNKKYDIHRVHMLSWVPPFVLFCFGVGTIIPYMMTQSLLARAGQVLVFFAVARIVKRVRVLYFVMLVLTVSIFYLMVPQGKVIFEYGIVRITEDALYEGLFRGLTLIGYIFLSLWCISPRLTLPSVYGRLLTQSIQFFDLLIDSSSRNKYRDYIKAQKQDYRHANKKYSMYKGLVARTDSLLLEVIKSVDDADANPASQPADQPTTQPEIGTASISKKTTSSQVLGGLLALASICGMAWWGLFL